MVSILHRVGDWNLVLVVVDLIKRRSDKKDEKNRVLDGLILELLGEESSLREPTFAPFSTEMYAELTRRRLVSDFPDSLVRKTLAYIPRSTAGAIF